MVDEVRLRLEPFSSRFHRASRIFPRGDHRPVAEWPDD
jgi:hypothetical protein